MDEKMQNMIVDWLGNTRTHDDWLVCVRFGREQLLSNPEFLAQIIADEVEREFERKNETDPGEVPNSFSAPSTQLLDKAEIWERIMRELNMELADVGLSVLHRLLSASNRAASFGRLSASSPAAGLAKAQMNADDRR
jgi:hypothetical protein